MTIRKRAVEHYFTVVPFMFVILENLSIFDLAQLGVEGLNERIIFFAFQRELALSRIEELQHALFSRIFAI